MGRGLVEVAFKKSCKKVLTRHLPFGILAAHTATQIAENMRTKALVAAAALLAAGALTSMAQSNVYSLNVVGYVNVALKAGFTMVGNQLDLDGTGNNNTVTTVFGTTLPSGSAVYAFSGAYDTATFTTKGGWAGSVAAVNAALKPGKGVFVKVPSDTTVTLVGNVMQGALNTPYVNGFNIVSSQVPQAGALQTDLAYVPTSGDTVFQFDAAAQNYKTAATYTTKGGWSAQPNVAVGEAFWLKSAAAAGGTWTRSFTVQ